MDDKWMVDDRCHVFSAHFPSGNWSDLPDPPWSRTRPGPASESSSSWSWSWSSSSSSIPTIKMKSIVSLWFSTNKTSISSIFTIHHSNIRGFSSKILPSLPALWLAPDVGFVPTAGLAWQIGWHRPGRHTSVWTSVCTSQGPELEGGLFSWKCTCWQWQHMVTYGNINNG